MLKENIEEEEKILIILIKVDKGKVGGQRRWIKKFLNVNIINFAKVDKGGG